MLSWMGIPPKLIRIIMALHTESMVKIKLGTEDALPSYLTGVKQGYPLSAILFNLYFQSAMEVLDEEWLHFEKPIFKTRDQDS